MSWIHSILQSLAVLTISTVVPPTNDALWKGAEAWQPEGKLLIYRATSENIVQECAKNPDLTLETPILLQGGHEIFLDGKLIVSTADRSFQVTRNFYNTATVPCQALAGGKEVEWHAFTQTHSLAKLNQFPTLVTPRFWGSFLKETANVMIAGTLIGLGILCFLMFYGKVESRLLTSIVAVCVSYSTTFVLFVPEAFQIRMRQTLLQSLSDICLWVGMIFTGRLFNLLGYTSNRLYKVLVALCCTGIAVIAVSGNLDQEQLGSNISFIGVYFFLIGTLVNRKLFNHTGKHRSRNEVFKALAVLSFILTSINDVLLAQVPIDSLPLVPFGVFCCTALLALAVNDRVVETYEERDYLRANLEKEVERKTEALKLAQADLVQSAKLAALGTLSAGIAHEINNALNYVNGSIDPINNILKKDQLTDIDRGKATKLLKLMKEGLDLTFGIIVNLKRHTSVTPGQLETLKLREVVDGILLLLKNKLTGVEVLVEMPDELTLHASRVSLSQVLINLIGNAADAIEEAAFKDEKMVKKITITGRRSENGVVLSVTDSGPGISPEIQERIFDPFFTTKAVGKGTGLGLHIVLTEVKKQGGKVEIKSAPGQGATFVLSFPDAAEGMAA